MWRATPHHPRGPARRKPRFGSGRYHVLRISIFVTHLVRYYCHSLPESYGTQTSRQRVVKTNEKGKWNFIIYLRRKKLKLKIIIFITKTATQVNWLSAKGLQCTAQDITFSYTNIIDILLNIEDGWCWNDDNGIILKIIFSGRNSLLWASPANRLVTLCPFIRNRGAILSSQFNGKKLPAC